MPYAKKIKNKAIMLRKKGYSIKEIAKIMKISASTSSLWCSTVQISNKAQKILATKQKLSLINANKTLSDKRKVLDALIYQAANNNLSVLHFSKSLCKLLCSIFIWTEGGKKEKYRVTFTNSDPIMIQTFLTLFRTSFDIDEHKFRCLIHIHEYHNEKHMKEYWSSITKIPIIQFNNSFHKANTKKRIRLDYKGSMHLTYYDTKVAHELRALYNTFAQKIVPNVKIFD